MNLLLLLHNLRTVLPVMIVTQVYLLPLIQMILLDFLSLNLVSSIDLIRLAHLVGVHLAVAVEGQMSLLS